MSKIHIWWVGILKDEILGGKEVIWHYHLSMNNQFSEFGNSPIIHPAKGGSCDIPDFHCSLIPMVMEST
jgi:hypothetical protein